MKSNYPPGVTGNEPQITGEHPCGHCGEQIRSCDDEAELYLPLPAPPDGPYRTMKHKIVHAEPCAQELLKKGWEIA
jgi:hypothetical protein